MTAVPGKMSAGWLHLAYSLAGCCWHDENHTNYFMFCYAECAAFEVYFHWNPCCVPRWSLQPARGQHGVGHRPSPSIPRSDHRRDRDKDRDISSRGPSASATSLRKEAVTPIPTPRSGAGVGQAMKTTGVGASRGAAQVRVQVQVPASKSTVASKAKGPAECPVCQLNFRGRLADWERQQHIQQCLESLEGVFDSEE